MKILVLLVLVLLIAFAVTAFYAMDLHKRMRGLEAPELWLPKKERRAYARELIARERDQYNMQRQQDLEQYIHKIIGQ